MTKQTEPFTIFGSHWTDLSVVYTPLFISAPPIIFILSTRFSGITDEDALKDFMVKEAEIVYGSVSLLAAITGLLGLLLMAMAHERWKKVDGIGKLIVPWGASAALASVLLEYVNSKDAVSILTLSFYVFLIALIWVVLFIVIGYPLARRRVKKMTNAQFKSMGQTAIEELARSMRTEGQ